ncbi:unnamed protein product, partial [Linum tenue]
NGPLSSLKPARSLSQVPPNPLELLCLSQPPPTILFHHRFGPFLNLPEAPQLSSMSIPAAAGHLVPPSIRFLPDRRSANTGASALCNSQSIPTASGHLVPLSIWFLPDCRSATTPDSHCLFISPIARLATRDEWREKSLSFVRSRVLMGWKCCYLLVIPNSYGFASI